MEYFFLIGFALAALLYVARPLFVSAKHPFPVDDARVSGMETELNFLKAKQRFILDNISEHEFEFAMGKLSNEDFERLRRGCENDLQAVNQSIEVFESGKDIADLIESEVDARRKLK
jgi:hypothetical protein